MQSIISEIIFPFIIICLYILVLFQKIQLNQLQIFTIYRTIFTGGAALLGLSLASQVFFWNTIWYIWDSNIRTINKLIEDHDLLTRSDRLPEADKLFQQIKEFSKTASQTLEGFQNDFKSMKTAFKSSLILLSLNIISSIIFMILIEFFTISIHLSVIIIQILALYFSLRSIIKILELPS